MITAFTAKLGAKNVNGARTYLFRVAKSRSTKSGSYSANRAKASSAFAMKPVCDHRTYCRNAAKAIYIGQTHHIAYRQSATKSGSYSANRATKSGSYSANRAFAMKPVCDHRNYCR